LAATAFSTHYERILANCSQTAYGIDGREEKYDGLSIQDPNRLDNNISGGSHNAKVAFNAFKEAWLTLDDRMKAAGAGQDIGPSILECVLGGNYSTYTKQREHMMKLK
jgi:non-canonical poly(A) RNA polymerase PAPD5/7